MDVEEAEADAMELEQTDINYLSKKEARSIQVAIMGEFKPLDALTHEQARSMYSRSASLTFMH